MSHVLFVLQFIGTMLLVLLVFNFIILVHEWGHFLAARWRGLKIEKFQIWMGQPIWKRTWNGVQYGLGWLPLGGFVALPQMAPMEAIEGGSGDGDNIPREKLPPVKPLDKIIVAFAGPLFSALLAVFFACLVWVAGKPEYSAERTTVVGYVAPDEAAAGRLLPGDSIRKIDGREVTRFLGIYDSIQWAVASSESNPIPFVVERAGVDGPLEIAIDAPVENTAEYREWTKKSWLGQLFARPPLRKVGIGPAMNSVIQELYPDSPAEEAGLQKGDRIEAVNGVKIYNMGTFIDMAAAADGQALTVEAVRDGAPLTVSLTPRKPTQAPPDELDRAHSGIRSWGPADTAVERTIVHPGPLQLTWHAVANTFSTLNALFSSRSAVSAGHLSGPVGIMNLYYEIFRTQDGWRLVLYFSIILNISLAILNLMPLPVLDGGHILMGVLEMIRGRTPSLRALEVVQMACVMLLLSFVLFVTLKDIGGLTAGEERIEIRFAPAPSS